LVLVAALLLFGRLTVADQRMAAEPGAGSAGEAPGREAVAGDSAALSPETRFLQKMLGESIPGLEPPPLAAPGELQEMAARAFCSVTGVDIRNPLTIINLELRTVALPYLPDLETGREGKAETRDPGRSEPDPSRAERPILSPRFSLRPSGEPQLLLYHTHITESFLPTSRQRYSQDLEVTVARLGQELVELLQGKYGFQVQHCRQVFDLPRTTAYERARPAIKEILAGNPDIRVVVDLHRDGVRRERTTAVINGKEVGRVLLVVGTRHDGWEANYRFALDLHRELEELAPGLSRGVLKQNLVYNQDLHPCSLLVEVGGHENSLEESLLAVPYLAEAFARTFYDFFPEG